MTPTRTCLAVLVVTAACGGSPKPASAPSPAPTAVEPAVAEPAATDDTEVATISGPGQPAPASEPAPPPRPKFDQAAFLARLHDADGPVAGLEAYVISHRADANVCGGVALEIRRKKGKKVAKADEVFVQVLELPALTGLDFGDATKQASLEKFNTWYADVETRSKAAANHYRDTIAAGDMKVAVGAAARIAQIARVVAARMARMEVPVNVRDVPEAIEAYCELLAEKAEPLLEMAEETARACAEKAAAAGVGDGWWTAVCTAP